MTRKKNVESVNQEKRIQQALEEYRLGHFLSYRAAGQAFNVPHNTLADRAKGKKPRNQAHEDQQILSSEEEMELVRWISRLTNCGYPSKPHTIKEMAEAIRTRRTIGVNNDSITLIKYDSIGEQWVSRFLGRHSQLASIMPEQIDAARVKETSYEVLQKWFTELKSIIDEHQIQPQDIYNMDETGYSVGYIKATRVIIDKTRNLRYSAIPGRQEWVSVIECICMDGTCLPPMIIFKGKTLTGRWLPTGGVPHNWTFSVNSKGWTSNEHMKKWLAYNFESHTREKANGRTRLLIFDGHGSHTTPDVLRHCILNNIQLALLPPHTSHKTQPLDVGVFSSMKSHMTPALDVYFRTQIPRIQKFEWLTAMIKARPLAFTVRNILSGWSGTGIHPFRPIKVLAHVPLPPPIEPLSRLSTPEFESPYLDPNLTSSPMDNPAMDVANSDLKRRASNPSAPFDTPSRVHIIRVIRTLNRSLARNRIQSKELSELQDIHTTRKRQQSGKFNILRGSTIIATPNMLQRLEKNKEDSEASKSKHQKCSDTLITPTTAIKNLINPDSLE
jgi:hypothetical protein